MTIFLVLFLVWLAAMSVIYLCKKLSEKGTIPGINDLEHVLQRIHSISVSLGDCDYPMHWRNVKERALADLKNLEDDLKAAIKANN